ncbi:MAG: peptide ABC transporter substrate-binding protein [Dehalococcoidales bacterium]|nr:peptide ABC transporter substrate-binding protein [Dehalococcoidales bacterium]
MTVAHNTRISNSIIFRLGLVVIIVLSLSLIVTSCSLFATQETSGYGTLNLSDTGPLTLDPATATEAGSASYILQIFNGLVQLNNSLQIVPDIAERWDISEDAKTYTFYLRHDVKFHDGKGVTANDFKYSWERALNPATQSLTAGTYLNDIVGASEVISGATTQLSGVKVLNDYTLEVNITTPIPYFLDKMAYPTAFVVDEANVTSGSNWWRNPNGTGPFKLQQWQTDQLLVLERNAGFYGEKAKLHQVVFKLYSGNSMQLYQSGEVDITAIGAAYIGLATDPANPVSEQLAVFPSLSVYYLGFNTTEPPFDDVKIRQAFSHAVDKNRVLTLAADNIVPAANGILPPDMPGYNSELEGLVFDVQKALQLIAESKYGSVSNLPPIVLTTGGWGNNISGLEGGIIAEWERNLGVQVTVRQLEPEYYSYVLNQEKDELFDFGWIADYPDPQNFLEILFFTGNQYNIGGYNNPQLDALLAQASVESNSAERMKIYQDAEQIIVRDAAVLPLYFGRTYILIQSYVQGYELSPLGYARLNEVSIQN